MKTKFLAASALLLMTSGAAMAVPVPATDAVSLHAAVNSAMAKTGSFTSKLTAPTVSAVPLPAAGWMLLAGLGGIAVMRRRAKV